MFVVCCDTGQGVANMLLTQVSTAPEAKSAYVKVLNLSLINTTTPGELEDIGTITV